MSAWRNMATDPPPDGMREILGWNRLDGSSEYWRCHYLGWITPTEYQVDPAELWQPWPADPDPSEWPEPPQSAR